MKRMKMSKPIVGRIALLDEDFDTATCTRYFRVIIWCDDVPNLKLGKCKVIQDE